MKHLLTLFLFASSVGIAQTTYYSDSNGMPIGTAQSVGNMTYYSNANGMPIGTAQSAGGTTYYSNANGMPVGTAQSPQQYQQAPVYNSPAPTFPTGPLFPSSPRGM